MSQTPLTPQPAAPAQATNPERRTLSALIAHAGGGVMLSQAGEVLELNAPRAARALSEARLLVCHAGFTARRLGAPHPARRPSLFDIMELWAFVRPAEPCVPTPKGLALALNLPVPQDSISAAALLFETAARLLADLNLSGYPYKDKSAETARTMGRAGWAWAPDVLAALGEAKASSSSTGLEIWNALPEWEDRAPPGQAGSEPVSAEDARKRLDQILASDTGTHKIEVRAEQSDYAAASTAAFAPRDRAGHPSIVLAQAGTGIGKTLGYLAPASLWAARNGPGVWISTYTKNLQRQIDQELDRLYPSGPEKAARTLVPKGRENYLCLLNFQEKAQGRSAIEMGLIARWARYSRDGDMVGGDFPAWATPLFHPESAGAPVPAGLTDRRGECIFAACPHYRKCFIEKAVRKARHTEIVVANHALVMVQAALDGLLGQGGKEEGDTPDESPRGVPVRYVFDEGHHLFDAADSAFSSSLSGVEAAELRRWIRGPEMQGRRGRDLRERCAELIGDQAQSPPLLDEVQRLARHLPGPGWLARLAGGMPKGQAESFLAAIAAQTLARQEGRAQTAYDLESAPWPAGPDVLETAAALERHLQEMGRALRALAGALAARLEDTEEKLDPTTRARLESLERSLVRRGGLMIPAWVDMLKTLREAPRPRLVDWFGMARRDTHMIDVGMHRHWIDPTEPFAREVLERAHGALITSATLKDDGPPPENAADEDAPARDWQAAELRTGAAHLALPARRHVFDSPFDYAARTRVFIVSDVSRTDRTGIAAAYQRLFAASGGGALGLFTSIARMRHTYEKICTTLETRGLPLYAQHIDAMDTGTLVDIFRLEENACLLGTDALRDGIDVPGPSLRLIVFDRVPWPRPDLLHKARRAHFGGRAYDDMLTRLRLAQAFGRLMRRMDDRGVFVMLDSAMPTRLTSAFPPGTPRERLTLTETARAIEKFTQRPNIEAQS